MEDFKAEGVFWDVSKKHWENVKDSRPSLGGLPNKAVCDPEIEKKIREQATPP